MSKKLRNTSILLRRRINILILKKVYIYVLTSILFPSMFFKEIKHRRHTTFKFQSLSQSLSLANESLESRLVSSVSLAFNNAANPPIFFVVKPPGFASSFSSIVGGFLSSYLPF